ncbi:MAG: U32 family peptidase [bacterium]|nr:U32 family peptidase [bacterium]MDW8163499.1 U32 family peptidase [Candidatus Omnitrophota bacterium]
MGKIKYSIGYQLKGEENKFFNIVEKYKERIEEVYFPWLNIPSGRGIVENKLGYINWAFQKQLENELKKIKKIGVKLNLLLNASCWGEDSLSVNLANMIISIIDCLKEDIGIDAITTSSPIISYIIKKNFTEIEIRASVNMRIGTIKQMEQIKELFDGFIIQREYNRDFKRIEELKNWCEKNRKKLSILVNSGCINFCPVQLFHDNVISHEKEILTKINLTEDILGNCWSFYKNIENWKYLILNSWIRPEDLHYYEKYFDVVKLATRINPEPEKVIKAYYYEKYEGNLLDLFEPSHSKLLYPYIIDNTRFPDNWFEKVIKCDKKCENCSYCEKIFDKVLIKKC